jgi:hypothetical protein
MRLGAWWGTHQADAFQIDQFLHALGPHAGIHADDVAAHAVAQQVHRLVR